MIKLRNANNGDCYLLFNWVNDEDIRRNSFNSEPVELEVHEKWFKSKMNDKNCKIFIIIKDEEPVGQIRVDIENDIGIISFSLDSRYRGMGIGSESLKLIKEKFEDTLLIGKVKKDNIASIKAFEKSGYSKIEEDKYMIFSK